MSYDFSKLVLNKAGKILTRNHGLIVPIVKGEPVPPGPGPEPEPTDPIEEYQVDDVGCNFTSSSSDGESYEVTWAACEEDWFDGSCQYEITTKQGDAIVETSLAAWDDDFYYVSSSEFIDAKEYTFEVRVVKGNKKSLPGTASDTYRDPFHDETIYIPGSDLVIPYVGDTTGYTLTWDAVPGAAKYEVYLDSELYKTTTSTSIGISDKDPGYYDLTIKAYNFKNTVIEDGTSLSLYDPMEHIKLDIYNSQVEYSDGEVRITPYIPYSPDGDYDYSIPDYLSNRLGTDSLEIIIDGETVYTGDATGTVSPIDVSDLSSGEYSISFKVTSTYGSSKESDSYTFTIEETCGLKDNEISSIDASVSSGDLNIYVSFAHAVSESDELTCSINSNTVSVQPSGSGLEIVIYSNEFGNYGITPGETNTIDVEVSCDTHSESITGSTSVDIPSQCQLATNYINVSEPSDTGSDIYFDFSFGESVDESYTISLNGNTVLSDTTDTSFLVSYDDLINSYSCDYGHNSVELKIECDHGESLCATVEFDIPESEDTNF